MSQNKPRAYWLVKNEFGQPLYTKGDTPESLLQKGRVFLFITKNDAKKFLELRKKLDEKFGLKRTIIKVYIHE